MQVKLTFNYKLSVHKIIPVNNIHTKLMKISIPLSIDGVGVDVATNTVPVGVL